MDDTEDTWDRLRPDWLNPATVRGAAFIIGGLLALTVPDLSERLLGLIFVAILAIKGVTDFWTAWKKRPFDLYSLLVGLVETAMAPLSSSLGFRPDLKEAEFARHAKIEILESRKVNACGYWKLIRFRNTSPSTMD